MSCAVRFYRALEFDLRYGGEGAAFTSFLAGSSYLNLMAMPAERGRPWWGRVIFCVADVDAVYHRALEQELVPDSAPADGAWGERYFHICDPDGHEISFAMPLAQAGARLGAR